MMSSILSTSDSMLRVNALKVRASTSLFALTQLSFNGFIHASGSTGARPDGLLRTRGTLPVEGCVLGLKRSSAGLSGETDTGVAPDGRIRGAIPKKLRTRRPKLPPLFCALARSMGALLIVAFEIKGCDSEDLGGIGIMKSWNGSLIN